MVVCLSLSSVPGSLGCKWIYTRSVVSVEEREGWTRRRLYQERVMLCQKIGWNGGYSKLEPWAERKEEPICK